MSIMSVFFFFFINVYVMLHNYCPDYLALFIRRLLAKHSPKKRSNE